MDPIAQCLAITWHGGARKFFLFVLPISPLAHATLLIGRWGPHRSARSNDEDNRNSEANLLFFVRFDLVDVVYLSKIFVRFDLAVDG